MPGFIDEHVRVVLLDIEGTTTPIEFVRRTLFGYARENLREFLARTSNRREVRTCIDGFKIQHANDTAAGEKPPAWRSDTLRTETLSAAEYGLWLMDRDSKLGLLKELQGWMWQEGYESGRLKGRVYPDVPPAFERWRKRGLDIGIYSSGSVLAQQLLFRTTECGDLTKYIVAFFDTGVGAKSNPASYQKIATLKRYPPDRFLFLSDVSGELDAARAAGMRATLVIRSQGGSSFPSAYAVIHSFDDLS